MLGRRVGTDQTMPEPGKVLGALMPSTIRRVQVVRTVPGDRAMTAGTKNRRRQGSQTEPGPRVPPGSLSRCSAICLKLPPGTLTRSRAQSVKPLIYRVEGSGQAWERQSGSSRCSDRTTPTVITCQGSPTLRDHEAKVTTTAVGPRLTPPAPSDHAPRLAFCCQADGRTQISIRGRAPRRIRALQSQGRQTNRKAAARRPRVSQRRDRRACISAACRPGPS